MQAITIGKMIALKEQWSYYYYTNKAAILYIH